MKKLLVAMLCLLWPLSICSADQLVWNLPGGIGQVGLPFQSTEALYGYDLVLKQNIVGASLPILAIKNVVFGQVGAAGMFGSQSLNAQPYLAIGADVMRMVPALDQFKSIHVNGFGRWATDIGKPGAGLSISWSFAAAS